MRAISNNGDKTDSEKCSCPPTAEPLKMREETIVLTTALISETMYLRGVLSPLSFSKVRLGEGYVYALRKPEGKCLSILHRGCYVWLKSDLRRFLKTSSPHTRVLVAVAKCPAEDGNLSESDLVEIFSLSIHDCRSEPPVTGGSQSIKAGTQCLLRSLRCYLGTLPRLLRSHIMYTQVDDGSSPHEDPENRQMIDGEDALFSLDSKEAVRNISMCPLAGFLPRMHCNPLGTLRTTLDLIKCELYQVESTPVDATASELK